MGVKRTLLMLWIMSGTLKINLMVDFNGRNLHHIENKLKIELNFYVNRALEISVSIVDSPNCHNTSSSCIGR